MPNFNCITTLKEGVSSNFRIALGDVACGGQRETSELNQFISWDFVEHEAPNQKILWRGKIPIPYTTSSIQLYGRLSFHNISLFQRKSPISGVRLNNLVIFIVKDVVMRQMLRHDWEKILPRIENAPVTIISNINYDHIRINVMVLKCINASFM